MNNEIKASAPKQKKNSSPDRVNLLPTQSSRIESWVNQVKSRSQGSVRVSKSDLVNFFLEALPDSLSEDEIIKIETHFYDEVRWLSWAQKILRQKQASDEDESLESLLEKRKQRSARALEVKNSNKNSKKKPSNPAKNSAQSDPSKTTEKCPQANENMTDAQADRLNF